MIPTLLQCALSYTKRQNINVADLESILLNYNVFAHKPVVTSFSCCKAMYYIGNMQHVVAISTEMIGQNSNIVLLTAVPH